MKEERKMSMSVTEVSCLLDAMNKCQRENPEATVCFNLKQLQIDILYPLPKEYWRIVRFKVEMDK